MVEPARGERFENRKTGVEYEVLRCYMHPGDTLYRYVELLRCDGSLRWSSVKLTNLGKSYRRLADTELDRDDSHQAGPVSIPVLDSVPPEWLRRRSVWAERLTFGRQLAGVGVLIALLFWLGDGFS